MSSSGDPDDDPENGGDADRPRRSRLSRAVRRLMDPRELSGDAVELATSLLETSDRAKTEIVRMVAREVRTYLNEMKLKEDLRDLLTGHSLEVQMSLSLKPKPGMDPVEAEEAPSPAAPDTDETPTPEVAEE